MNKCKNNCCLDKEIVLGSNCDDNNRNGLSMTFDTTGNDQLENDMSTLIDLPIPSSLSFLPNHSTNQEHLNIPFLSNLISLEDFPDKSSSFTPMVGSAPIPTDNEDKCRLPSYIPFMRTTSMDPVISPYLTYGSMDRPQFSHQDSEFQLLNGGPVHPDYMPGVFNSDLQAPSSEGQHLIHGAAVSSATEILSLEDPSSKAGKLSVEERKLKICRYKKKRNERNFTKTIKYACRKTLADTRPRVRGRFAKNDELGDMARTYHSNHEYDDTDEDVNLYSNFMPDQCEVGTKVRGEDLDSSDIFAHISGVNSFKPCNYPIQSWI